MNPRPQDSVIADYSPYGEVVIWNEDATAGEWVAFKVIPDSGYSLYDLDVYGWPSKDSITYYPSHRYDGVYWFEMPSDTSYVVIDADFTAVPSEYRVYINPMANGDVEVDDIWASEGEWVYLTVEPDAGYRLADLSVTMPSGYEVKLEHVRANVFRFAMPGVRVEVDADFELASMPFTDVSRGQWFYSYVYYAYTTGLMDGVSYYSFAPDSASTRAMVVQILYRMAGSPYVSGTSGFGDVSAAAWYSDAVTWAVRNNVVEGRSDTVFDPNAAVSRQELATMLYRYARLRGYSTAAGENTNILSYKDVSGVSDYAFSALQWACGEGIVNGTGGGYLSPHNNATRAQLAAMLYRFSDVYVF